MIIRFFLLSISFAFLCGFTVLSAQINIIVKDEFDKNLGNTQVQIYKNDQQIAEGFTDIQGQLSVSLPKGVYEIIVFKDLYVPVRYTVEYTNQVSTFIISVDSTTSVLLDSLTFFGSSELAGFNGNVEVNRLQYRTMTASFQDPSRILLHFPGFTTDNDGTNSFIFRGMPSYGHTWMIDNVEIINPNHLSTAGNRGDALSLNSGGVNSISGSVINGYSFISNPASVTYDNIMGGVSNVKLSESIRNFADFNLVGFEAGLGNSYKDKRFYATFRYSFVGLLEQLGVSFGNESIQYKDLTLYSELYKSKKAAIKSYFIYGTSSNRHNAIDASEPKEIFKDFKNIYYQGKLSIGGMSFDYAPNSQQRWNINLAVSQRNDLNQESIDQKYSALFSFDDKEVESINGLVSLHACHDFRNNKLYWKSGLRYSNTFMDITQNGIINRNHYVRAYPYSLLKFSLTKGLVAEGGMALQLNNLRSQKNLSLNLSGEVKWEFHHLFYSEVKYRRADFAMLSHINDVVMTAQGDHIHFVLGMKNAIVQLRGTLFTHIFSGIPVGKSLDLMDMFSGFHGSDFGTDVAINLASVHSSGFGNVYGCDFFGNIKQGWNKNHLEALYSISLFSSKYKNPGMDWDNSKNNVGYVMHSSVYYSLNSRNTSKWIAGISMHYRGGQRDAEIRTNPTLGESIYIPNSLFSFRYNAYRRLDFRIVYSKSGDKGVTHRFSLDIQNLSGNQNEGLRYFDAFLNTIINQNQLGLVPVLGYRVEF